MTCRTILIALAVSGLVFAGCGKKPKQAQVQTPAPVAVTAPAKDTGDVFNEYYKDGRGKDKKISKTFSMHAPESYSPQFSDNGTYVVQIAAASSRMNADELAVALKAKGYPAYVTEVQNPTPTLQGTYYRVRIGGFLAMSDARAFGENILRQANYDYWVDSKSNESIGYGTPSIPSPSTYGTSTTPAYTPTPTETNYGTTSTTATPAAAPATETSTSSWMNGSSTTTSSTTTTEPAPSSTSTTAPASSWSAGSSSTETTTPAAAPAETSATTPAATPSTTTTPEPSTNTGTWGGTGWKDSTATKW
jgi:hypothetical protein